MFPYIIEDNVWAWFVRNNFKHCPNSHYKLILSWNKTSLNKKVKLNSVNKSICICTTIKLKTVQTLKCFLFSSFFRYTTNVHNITMANSSSLFKNLACNKKSTMKCLTFKNGSHLPYRIMYKCHFNAYFKSHCNISIRLGCAPSLF